ncbi:hypothetical protein TCON_0108 [Astathelohania contejeani]|uniref:Uncharacterized protein n=1 Tax=Astathelohania contejeani TaxID=164912 RepID=A0ABQ7I2P8_9MICR|nr:hypothetical protein TCON_0108 [Thelohania contejeani]
MLTLREYLTRFIKFDGKYTPKDKSSNELRHYNSPDLTIEDVLYLYCKNTQNTKNYNFYFFLRNNKFNLFDLGPNRYLLYNRTKHFNRKKDRPIGVIKGVDRYEIAMNSLIDEGEEIILGIESEEIFMFLKLKREKLDFIETEGIRK